MMKKIIFLLSLPLWGLGGFGSALASVTVTPLSTDFINKKVTFRVEYANAANNRAWVWIDLCPVSGVTPTTFQTAVISAVSATGGSVDATSLNGRGFYVTTNPSTVTATLSNATGKFKWCAYGSDFPPNAAIIAAGYQLKGTPPFDITYDNGSATSTSTKTFTLGCINTLTDATGCPGLIEALAAPATSSNGSRCNAGTVSISATPPASSTIDWYTTSSGSTLVANGSGKTTLTTPSISVTTNYYAASRHLVTGCVSSSRRTVTATVTNGSGRDVAPKSCGCASGLTSVGGYCRDLVADGASTYTGCGFEIKKQYIYGTIGQLLTMCPSGWRLPSLADYACIWNRKNQISDFTPDHGLSSDTRWGCWGTDNTCNENYQGYGLFVPDGRCDCCTTTSGARVLYLCSCTPDGCPAQFYAACIR